MNYRCLLTFLFVLTLQLVNAQDFERDFGKCSRYELELKECSFDNDAGAMVIYDIGKLVEHPSLAGYSLERTVKIKIFNKAGFDAGNFAIQYLEGNRIMQLKGNTYNLVDGKIVKTPLKTKETFDEQVFEEIYSKKIAFPEIREGSVIELKYTNTGISYTNIPSWYFQKSIPVLYSEYNAILDPLYEYRHRVSGEYKLDSYTNDFVNTIPYTVAGKKYFPTNRKFVMSEIPAFTDKSFITCEDDYITKVDFQVIGYTRHDGIYESVLSTWTEIIDKLLDFDKFGQFLKASEREGKKYINILSSLPDIEKVIWIDQHIKKTIKYNNRNSYIASDDAHKINDEKTGNSADLNLTAIGLLRAAGLQANPVLLSTRDNGKVYTTLPFLDAFNYVVGLVLIDSTYYIIDVTEPLLKFGDIPTRCLNDQGLVVEAKKENWVDIKTHGKSDVKYIINLTPNDNRDSSAVECNIISTYYEALEKRKEYINDYEALAKDMIGQNYKLFDSLKCANLKDPDKDFEMNFTTSKPIEQVDSYLIIEPFAGYIMTENPLKEPDRKYPVDFTYNWSRTYSVTLNVPEGYRLSSQPENLIINDKNIRVVYTVSEREPGVLNILGLFHFKKDIYLPSEYQALKGYYDKIISKFNEKITLEAVEI